MSVTRTVKRNTNKKKNKKKLDLNPPLETRAVFLDINKAFD